MVDVEGRGTAAAIRFEGDEHYRVTDGTFTTCKPGQDDWFIQAEELDIDMQREVGTARGGSLTFFGVSTPRIPWFDFSLNNERKSGFLPPTFGVQSANGFEMILPFYWNIAPNYDATIAPRYMAKRGLQFLNQFRFLLPYATGEARYEILPEDKSLNNETRYATALVGTYNFLNGFSGLVNYQKVSDDNYFRDLSSRLSIATQLYLPQQILASYGAPSGYWSATANYQRFQTLQDAQNPVPVPYFREPQFLLNALRPTPVGLDVGFRGEYVNFGNAALVPTGSRATAYPWVSYPMVRSYGYITPKVGVTGIGYSLSNPGTFTDERPSVTLPIASVDSGLYFERDTRWFGTDYLQTLEPRAYYLYVPFKDQSAFPVFDTTNSRPQLHPALPGEHLRRRRPDREREPALDRRDLAARPPVGRPGAGARGDRPALLLHRAEGDDPGPAGADPQHIAPHPRARGPHHAALDRRPRHAVPVWLPERLRRCGRRGTLFADAVGGGEHRVPLHEPAAAPPAPGPSRTSTSRRSGRSGPGSTASAATATTSWGTSPSRGWSGSNIMPAAGSSARSRSSSRPRPRSRRTCSSCSSSSAGSHGSGRIRSRRSGGASRATRSSTSRRPRTGRSISGSATRVVRA